jgi:hypothetical protein
VDIRECGLQQIRSIFPEEDRVCLIRILRCIKLPRHEVGLNKCEQPSQDQALKLESALVIGIGEHEEDILHDANEVELEEAACNGGIRAGEVVNNLQAHCVRIKSDIVACTGYGNIQFKPISAMSRMVCLMAHMILSTKSLNCSGGKVKSAIDYIQQSMFPLSTSYVPGKQLRLIARRSLKKPTRCSGYSEKSRLIMFNVGMNTASRMGGT